MATVHGTTEGRINIVWYEDTTNRSVSAFATTANTRVIYKTSSTGALLTYIPGQATELQGFTEFSAGGYWILALANYELPGIINLDLSSLTGSMTLAGFSGTAAVTESSVAPSSIVGAMSLAGFSGTASIQEAVANTLTGSISLAGFSGTASIQEAVANTLTGSISLAGFSGTASIQEAVANTLTGSISLAGIGGTANIEEAAGEVSSLSSPNPNHTGLFNLNTESGSLVVKGTATAGVSVVEARWAGGDWTSLSSLTFNGSNFVGVLSGLPPGRGTLDVRALGQVSTPQSVTPIQVGLRAGVQSQSGGSGRGNTPYDTYDDNGTGFSFWSYNDLDNWVEAVDPLDSSLGTSSSVNIERDGNAGGSWWISMVNHWMSTVTVRYQGSTVPCPVSIVVGSAGDTATSQWQPDYVSPGGSAQSGDRFTVTNSSQNLYNNLLSGCRTAYEVDTGETLEMSIIIMHFGPADIYGDAQRRTVDNIPLFISRVESIIAANLANYGCRSMIGILQNCTGSIYNQTTGGVVNQVLIRDAQQQIISQNDNAVAGGDLSVFTTDDDVHITNSAKNIQAGTAWGVALENWYTEFYGSLRIQGSMALAGVGGTASVEEVPTPSEITGTMSLAGVSGSASVAEIDTVKNDFVHFWELDQNSGETRLDSVGGNDFTELGGAVASGTFTAGTSDQKGADYSVAGGILSTASGINLNGTDITVVLAVEVVDDTSDENYFKQWDDSDGSYSIDRRPTYTPGAAPSGAGFRLTIRNDGGDLAEVIIPLNVTPAGVYLLIAEYNATTGSASLNVNGSALSANGTLTGGIRTLASTPITMGEWLSGARRVNGIIGFAGLLRRTLTPGERDLLWNGGELYQAFSVRNDVTGSMTLAGISGTANVEESGVPSEIEGTISLAGFSGTANVVESTSTLTNGIVGAWPLTANFNDASPNGNDLIEDLRNGDSSIPISAAGADFSGLNASNLRLPGNTGLLGTVGFAISFVTNVSSLPNSNFSNLWSFNDGLDGNAVYAVDITTGGTDRLRGFVNGTELVSINTPSFPTNTDILVILSYSQPNSSVDLLIRPSGGNWVTDSATFSANLVSTNAPFEIGVWQAQETNSSQWRNPEGIIRHFHLWDRGLDVDTADSQSEVNQLYGNGSFPAYPFT